MRRLRFFIGALLAVLWAAPLHAQQPAGTVRGRVVEDASQQPLARVTVAIGSRGAVSQADGSYIITGVPAGAASLRARMLGYAPVTRSVTVVSGQTTVVDVAMTAQAVTLAEVVVTGYGEQSAGNITGAVAQITPDEFNPGRITAPAQLLQSKVAGVQVVDNNRPGGGTTIRIRGATSINASSDPLYVIDGMPIGSGGLSAGGDPLNFLNPNDIESITVLKDASAAAIYGANAANGVVLITTKSATGRRGQQIDYGSSFSASTVTRLPQILSASQFRTAVQTYAPTRVASLGNATTNWFDLVDRTAYGQEHNLSVTNAGERMFYRLSLGYLRQDGIIQATTTERLSLGFNYEQRLLDNHLDVKANLKGSRANDRFTPGDVLGNAVSMAPTQPVFDSTSRTGYWDWSTGNASAFNPVAFLSTVTNRGTAWRSLGNVQADYRFPFFEALKANLNLGYDVARADNSTFYPSYLPSQQRQGHGSLTLTNNSQVTSVVEAYLNYSAALGFVPGSVDLTGGYSYSQSHSEFPRLSETGLRSDFLSVDGIPSADNVSNTKSVVDYKAISFFGRVNYNYNDRFLLAASVRRDGSSRFGPGNQWGVFPAVSGAWRISQESFMRGFTSLSDLKIRASWAKTGNQSFGDYLWATTYSFSNPLAQTQLGTQFVTMIRPSAVDPNIKWEATKSWDIGLDFGFLNQRFNGAIDWYTKNTSDLIFQVPVAAGTNFSNYVTTNVGSMRNRGIEVTLSARILEGRGGDLGWTANFTASHNSNQLTAISSPRVAGVKLINIGNISGGVGNTVQVLMPGQPINSFYVYEQRYDTLRTSATFGMPIEGGYVDQPTVLDTIVCRGSGAGAAGCVGNYRPDGIINSGDLRPFHSPWPSLELGHTSYFTYKAWDFSLTLRAQLGAYVYNNVASSTGAYQNLTGSAPPGNMDASVLQTGFVVPQYLSDYYVQSASFLRMDNITLGYTFQMSGRPWRVYLTVQNAFTITGYKGVDPTAGLQGIDNNIYPRSRTFTGGLSARF